MSYTEWLLTAIVELADLSIPPEMVTSYPFEEKYRWNWSPADAARDIEDHLMRHYED